MTGSYTNTNYAESGVQTINGTLIQGGLTVTPTQSKVVTAQVDVTSSTALVAVTGLAIPLAAGGTYVIEGYLPGTSNVSGGAKISLDTSDTLTATSFSLHGYFMTASAVATATTTTLGTGVGSTALVIATEFQGSIVVNAAGTLVVKFAQNASNGAASSVYVNGFLKVTRVA